MIAPKNLRVKWRGRALLAPVAVFAIFAALPPSYDGYIPFFLVAAAIAFVIPQMVAEVIDDNRINAFLETLSSSQINDLMDEQRNSFWGIRLSVLLEARQRATARESSFSPHSQESIPHDGS